MFKRTGNQEAPGDENSSLSVDFQKTLDLYEELANSAVPTNDAAYQAKVKAGINRLQEMTRTVNQLGLFSANESITEVATEHLKYLLLPALLADFSLRNHTFDRLEMLSHAEIYFRDYISRLNDYGVCDIELKKADEEVEEFEAKSKSEERPIGQLKRDPLVSSAIFRDTKINRYKESRRLEEQLASLKRMIVEQENNGASIDEDLERQFYITLISSWLTRAVDELASIEMEKPMAKMRLSVVAAEKRNGTRGQSGGSSRSKPLKPIIITRDAIQKKVYGVGYPSIPTVTVDEFIGKKMADGSLAFNDKRVYGNSLYDWANDPEKKKAEDISEEERKERLVEADDPVELERQRKWDDWKDEHKRGEGNRHNMG